MRIYHTLGVYKSEKCMIVYDFLIFNVLNTVFYMVMVCKKDTLSYTHTLFLNIPSRERVKKAKNVQKSIIHFHTLHTLLAFTYQYFSVVS